MKRKLLSLLAILMMALTAQAATRTVTWNKSDITGTYGESFTKDGITVTVRDIDFEDTNFVGPGTFTTASGKFTKIVVSARNTVSGTGWTGSSTEKTWEGEASSSVPFSGDIMGMGMYDVTMVFTIEEPDAAPAGTALTPDATRKVWTLDEMPAGNVELQVAYFPGMLVKPTSLVGGTMEIEGVTDTTLPEGFEKDDAGNIYVEAGKTFTVKAVPAEGYHLVGWSDDATIKDLEREFAMPADGSDFTVTATFSDEFELTFDDVNFKTNQNITVKVGDADKTLDQDGKLSVKSGQTVTLTAKQGYKFRSVEAKKAGEPAATFVTGAVNANNLKVGDILKDVTSISGTGYFTLAENRYKENGTKQPYGAALEVGQIKTFSGYTITTTWDAVMTPIDDKGQDGNAWIVTGNDGNGPVVAGYTVTGN